MNFRRCLPLRLRQPTPGRTPDARSLLSLVPAARGKARHGGAIGVSRTVKALRYWGAWCGEKENIAIGCFPPFHVRITKPSRLAGVCRLMAIYLFWSQLDRSVFGFTSDPSGADCQPIMVRRSKKVMVWWASQRPASHHPQ